MCGIVGLWDPRHNLTGETADAVIRRMAGTLAHRGPDDEGYFAEPTAGLMLGFRRLSIVDISPQGHQPMASGSGRYVIVFNGEVYNYARLRPELAASGFSFRGHSDTEVILAAIEHWGVESAVKRFIGMFAFALWDRQEHSLTLVRDRVGVKPLYYGWVGSCLVFCSELKALRVVPGFTGAINRDALTLFLRHSCIPAPYSVYQGIQKLMPGTFLKVGADQAADSPSVETLAVRATTYWSVGEVADDRTRKHFTGTVDEAVEQLDTLLRDAVALRMEADVPLGAFLSGGVDSSMVVALMQAQSTRPVQTFSVGFSETGYDEAPHAAAVARHVGTAHSELYVTPRDALAVIPGLGQIYDEPFADSSQIPTFLVSRFARQTVTVSLSGDGGDEVFAGYNRYVFGSRLWRRIGMVPKPLRYVLASLLRANPQLWAGVLKFVQPVFGSDLQLNNPLDKVSRMADAITLKSSDELYMRLVSHWTDPSAVVLDGREPAIRPTGCVDVRQLTDSTERMIYNDLVGYLPDDILTKLDRASMACSLEARVPFLDHRVVEFAWRLPMNLKMHGGHGKWLLRRVLDKYVPRRLIERPKQGFGVPIDKWLRGPLRDWAEALLSEDRLKHEGFFDPAPIRVRWLEHLSGTHRWHYHLWDVLMFQAWLEQSSAPVRYRHVV